MSGRRQSLDRQRRVFTVQTLLQRFELHPFRGVLLLRAGYAFIDDSDIDETAAPQPRKTAQIYFYSNRDLAVILSYTGTGISEHGIFHGITTYQKTKSMNLM